MYRLLVLFYLAAVTTGAVVPDNAFQLLRGQSWLKSIFRTGRIVGGTAIEITQAPYQLSLEWNKFQFCGAAIISESFAITAGHCVNGWDAQDLTVRTGAGGHEFGGTVIRVKEIIRNPQYDSNTMDYDVSLLLLASNIVFNQFSQPIPLADFEPEVGTSITVTGWGAVREAGPAPSALLTVDVPIVARGICQIDYHGHTDITERMFCAGEVGKDSCQGDSGGPAYFRGTLVGIVSWGLGCARGGFPGVYTSIANREIREFIRNHAGI